MASSWCRTTGGEGIGRTPTRTKMVLLGRRCYPRAVARVGSGSLSPFCRARFRQEGLWRPMWGRLFAAMPSMAAGASPAVVVENNISFLHWPLLADPLQVPHRKFHCDPRNARMGDYAAHLKIAGTRWDWEDAASASTDAASLPSLFPLRQLGAVQA